MDLPDEGIVLVAGPKGWGKSAGIEGVASAVWGKSVRGASLWNEDAKTQRAEVALDHVRATREPLKTVKLSFSVSESETQEDAQTTTEAQRRLDSILPLSFRQWRKSCLLSLSEMDTITRSSDAETKKVFEELVGADFLGSAYSEANSSLKEARSKEEQIERALERATVRESEVAKRLADSVPPEDAEEILDFSEEDEKNLANLTHQGKVLSNDIGAQRKNLNERRASISGEIRAVQSLRQRSENLLGASICPTCTQPIPSHLEKTVKESVDGYESRLVDLKEEIKALESVEEDIQNQEVDLEEMKSLWSELAAKKNSRDTISKTLVRLSSVREKAAKDLAEVRGEKAVLKDSLDEASKKVRNLAAVALTLSPKGLRSKLLNATLASVEAAANVWLIKLGSPFSLRFRATQKDGVVEKIKISLHHSLREDFPIPYKGASGGERRRVDLALLFALSQVAEAATGSGKSTMFCDEIFDALDDKGVQCASKTLTEISQDRCVVVIAHGKSAELLAEVADIHLDLSP